MHISQAEAAVTQLDARYAAEEARAAGLPVSDDPTEHMVCRCAGEDEWCVISIRDADDRRTVNALLDGHGALDKATLSEHLQAAGVPAGPMNRAPDVLDHPQVRHRKLFTDMVHPLFDAPLPSESGPAPYHNIPPAEQRPAPMPGEHTRQVCQKVLGLDTAEIDRLIADGVLSTSASTTPRSPL